MCVHVTAPSWSRPALRHAIKGKRKGLRTGVLCAATQSPNRSHQGRPRLTRGRQACHSLIDKLLVLPVRDVTSVLSNASCLSSFENWLEAARLSRSGVLSRAAAGPPAQPTLNRLGP